MVFFLFILVSFETTQRGTLKKNTHPKCRRTLIGAISSPFVSSQDARAIFGLLSSDLQRDQHVRLHAAALGADLNEGALVGDVSTSEFERNNLVVDSESLYKPLQIYYHCG